MRRDRLAVYGTVGIILALTLATGPVVSLLSVPEGGAGATGGLGNGTASVSVVEAPDRAELVAGEYGNVHYLRVPESTIVATNVTGSPLLTASIDVDSLGYSRSSIFVVRETRDGTQTVEIERAPLNSTRIDRTVYEGRYQLVLRDDTGRTVVYDEPITIEVTG